MVCLDDEKCFRGDGLRFFETFIPTAKAFWNWVICQKRVNRCVIKRNILFNNEKPYREKIRFHVSIELKFHEYFADTSCTIAPDRYCAYTLFSYYTRIQFSFRLDSRPLLANKVVCNKTSENVAYIFESNTQTKLPRKLRNTILSIWKWQRSKRRNENIIYTEYL